MRGRARTPVPARRLHAAARLALLAIAVPAASAVPGAGGAAAQETAREARGSRCGAGVHADEAGGVVPFPQGELFCRLVADPKAERSFVSFLRGDFSSLADPRADADADIGAVGLGDSFGVLRWGGAGNGDGAQIDVVGSIFAQFDLGTASFDLINADYIIGVPLTVRRGGFSARLRLYHQSSHLGDEFLLGREPERVNLSFESLEAVLSQEVGPLRVYAGGEVLFRREPETLERHVAHAGVELRPSRPGTVRPVVALDLKSSEEQAWKPAWSARAGIEIGRAPAAGHPARVWSLLGEFYDGPAPYGQFYRDGIRYLGVGLHLSL